MAGNDIPGIRYDAVSRFFADNVPGGDVPLEFDLLAGGKSNVTYRASGGGQSWVLRRPPLGHVLPTAHDMVREYRVISAMAQTEVPAPKTVALCEDPAVNDYPFYVMEYVDGIVINDEIPPGYADTESVRWRMCEEYVETLAKLHRVDYNAVGLGDFGRPEGFLERQVRRWSEQWERSVTDPVPEIYEVIRRLKAALPEPQPPGIVHGDYRLGNTMLSKDDPGKIIAVLDWEMATLGDPLTDVGYMIMFWGDETVRDTVIGRRATSMITSQPGFMTRKQIAAEYGRRGGRSIDSIDFYIVLALYKLAVIGEGIHARFLAGETLGEGFDRPREAPAMIEMALEIADASDDPKLRG